MKITVTAKITAGVHPIHGAIIAGQTYTIEDHQFAEELFTRHPSPVTGSESPVTKKQRRK
jgi:hypothetical protein